MIRKESLLCKLFRYCGSPKEIYGSLMVSFRAETETCPYCQAKGECRIHAYYSRGCIDFRSGRSAISRIRVLRVICRSCGHTHAILPDCIIPFTRHSLTFILKVLTCFSCRRRLTSERICELFGLGMTTLHRWRKLYRDHKSFWLGVLDDKRTTDFAFLKNLCRLSQISSFLSSFYKRAGLSFLQGHRNPAANCGRLGTS